MRIEFMTAIKASAVKYGAVCMAAPYLDESRNVQFFQAESQAEKTVYR
jgi:hypothetical protein